MNVRQASLIKECFENGIDVHFIADQNDYNLFANEGPTGTLQVNSELDLVVVGVSLACGDSLLIIAMAGRSSGVCFTVDNEPGDEPVLWDDEDDTYDKDMEAVE